MKALLAILLMSLLLNTAAFGQGRVNFANSASTLITTNGSLVSQGTGLTVAAAGRYYFGLYLGSLGTPENLLTLALLATNVASAGRLSGGNPVALPAQYPAGTPLTFQIRGWSAFAGLSFEEAATKFNTFPCVYAGVSPLGQVTPTASPNPGGLLFGTSAGQLNSGFELYATCTPEPSTYALAILGTLALGLATRRRRR